MGTEGSYYGSRSDRQVLWEGYVDAPFGARPAGHGHIGPPAGRKAVCGQAAWSGQRRTGTAAARARKGNAAAIFRDGMRRPVGAR
jgi:hypothetical protein